MLKVNKKDFTLETQVRIESDFQLPCVSYNETFETNMGLFSLNELERIIDVLPKPGDELEIIKIEKNECAKVFFKKKDAEPILLNGREVICYAFWSDFKAHTELIGPAPATTAPVRKGNLINSFEVINTINGALQIKINIEGLGDCLLTKNINYGESNVAVNGLGIGRTRRDYGDEYAFEYRLDCLTNDKRRMTRRIAMDIINNHELRPIIFTNLIEDIKEWKANNTYHNEAFQASYNRNNSEYCYIYNAIAGKTTGLSIQTGDLTNIVKKLTQVRDDMSIKFGTDSINLNKI